jgi:hypothetical protein
MGYALGKSNEPTTRIVVDENGIELVYCVKEDGTEILVGDKETYDKFIATMKECIATSIEIFEKRLSEIGILIYDDDKNK